MPEFSYVLSTSVGQVRLLIPDRNSDAIIFADVEIDGFLAMEAGSVKKAAALALETIAADEALTQKVATVAGNSTNGAATAKSLMERAQKLRDQADRDDATDDSGGFDVAEMPVGAFAERERLYKQALRGEF